MGEKENNRQTNEQANSTTQTRSTGLLKNKLSLSLSLTQSHTHPLIVVCCHSTTVPVLPARGPWPKTRPTGARTQRCSGMLHMTYPKSSPAATFSLHYAAASRPAGENWNALNKKRSRPPQKRAHRTKQLVAKEKAASHIKHV